MISPPLAQATRQSWTLRWLGAIGYAHERPGQSRTHVPTDTIDTRRRLEGFAFLVAFGLCIPAANWLIGNAGTTCVPNGPA